jgi:hypothetical protein
MVLQKPSFSSLLFMQARERGTSCRGMPKLRLPVSVTGTGGLMRQYGQDCSVSRQNGISSPFETLTHPHLFPAAGAQNKKGLYFDL